MLLLNHPTLLRGNLCVGRIGNLIIIIFLVLVYSSTMRGAVNHVPPGFCTTCGAWCSGIEAAPHLQPTGKMWYSMKRGVMGYYWCEFPCTGRSIGAWNITQCHDTSLPPRFCPTCVAAGLTLRLTRTALTGKRRYPMKRKVMSCLGMGMPAAPFDSTHRGQ